MKTFDLLKRFAEAPGPSGNEAVIRDLVQESWKPLTDKLSVDRVGSLVGLRKGTGPEPRPRIMLAAHMDEIGLMVTKIDTYKETGGGFLRFTAVGGVDRRQLLGQSVIVHGSENGRQDLTGIIGSLPNRMLPPGDDTNQFRISDMVVDAGIGAEDLRNAVSVGDFISFRQPVKKLLNRRVTGKALDNRVSVTVLTRCLERLEKGSHYWDVAAVATAQEETALLGAYTSAFAQRADVAVAVDVTLAKGPGITEDGTFSLGDGPSIAIGPNVHPGIFKALHDAADALEMKVHVEPHARMSGTDAVGLQVARQGIPTGIVSVPIRYMHTSVEIVSLVDIKRAARLLTEFIIALDDSFLSSLADDLLGQ
jgi:endoglucanase